MPPNFLEMFINILFWKPSNPSKPIPHPRDIISQNTKHDCMWHVFPFYPQTLFLSPTPLWQFSSSSRSTTNANTSKPPPFPSEFPNSIQCMKPTTFGEGGKSHVCLFSLLSLIIVFIVIKRTNKCRKLNGVEKRRKTSTGGLKSLFLVRADLYGCPQA